MYSLKQGIRITIFLVTTYYICRQSASIILCTGGTMPLVCSARRVLGLGGRSLQRTVCTVIFFNFHSSVQLLAPCTPRRPPEPKQKPPCSCMGLSSWLTILRGCNLTLSCHSCREAQLFHW